MNTRSKRYRGQKKFFYNKSETTAKFSKIINRDVNITKRDYNESCFVKITPLEKSEYKEIYEQELKYIKSREVVLTDQCSRVPNLNNDVKETNPTITFVDIDKIIKQPPVETQQHSANISGRAFRANKLFFDKYGKRVLSPKSDISKSAIQLQRLDLSKFSKIDNITYSVTKGEIRKGQLNPISNKQYYLQIPKTTQLRQKDKNHTSEFPEKHRSNKISNRSNKPNTGKTSGKLQNKDEHSKVNGFYTTSNNRNSGIIDLTYSVTRKADILKSCQNNKRSKRFVVTDDVPAEESSTDENKNDTLKHTENLTSITQNPSNARKKINDNELDTLKHTENLTSITQNPSNARKKINDNELDTSNLCNKTTNLSCHTLPPTSASEKSIARTEYSPIKQYKLVFDESSLIYKDPYLGRNNKQKFNFNDAVYLLCNNKKMLKLPNSQWQFESNHKPSKKKSTGKNITVSYTINKKKFTKSLYFDVKNTVNERLSFNDICALKYVSFKRFQFKIKSMNVFRSADRVVDIYRDGSYKILADGVMVQLCGAPSMITSFSEIQILLNIVNSFKFEDNYISLTEDTKVD